MASTHGRRHTPEYACWLCLKQRCTNPKNPVWKHYGGRGITVCERWAKSFNDFYSDVGPRPQGDPKRGRSEYSLERIDNNGPYSPDNCRWAKCSAQQNNKRSNNLLSFRGVTQTRAQWERQLGLSKDLIKQRVALGWTTERILTTPVNMKFWPKHLRH